MIKIDVITVTHGSLNADVRSSFQAPKREFSRVLSGEKGGKCCFLVKKIAGIKKGLIFKSFCVSSRPA